MKYVITLNDAPYASERTYRGFASQDRSRNTRASSSGSS